MITSGLGRKIGVMLAAAVLCSAVAACAVEIGKTKPERADGGGQIQYYGGPKSPVWRGPVQN